MTNFLKFNNSIMGGSSHVGGMPPPAPPPPGSGQLAPLAPPPSGSGQLAPLPPGSGPPAPHPPGYVTGYGPAQTGSLQPGQSLQTGSLQTDSNQCVDGLFVADNISLLINNYKNIADSISEQNIKDYAMRIIKTIEDELNNNIKKYKKPSQTILQEYLSLYNTDENTPLNVKLINDAFNMFGQSLINQICAFKCNIIIMQILSLINYCSESDNSKSDLLKKILDQSYDLTKNATSIMLNTMKSDVNSISNKYYKYKMKYLYN